MTDTGTARKAALREHLATTRAALLAAISSLTEAELVAAAWSEGGQWTARDLIGHVGFAEGGMLTLIKRAVAGEPATPNPGFDLERFNAGRVRRAAALSISEIVDLLAQSRAETLALLESSTAADLDCAVHHPAYGPTTVAGVMTIIGEHEARHAEDLLAVHQRTAAE